MVFLGLFLYVSRENTHRIHRALHARALLLWWWFIEDAGLVNVLGAFGGNGRQNLIEMLKAKRTVEHSQKKTLEEKRRRRGKKRRTTQQQKKQTQSILMS
jgi:hypothetical protein